MSRPYSPSGAPAGIQPQGITSQYSIPRKTGAVKQFLQPEQIPYAYSPSVAPYQVAETPQYTVPQYSLATPQYQVAPAPQYQLAPQYAPQYAVAAPQYQFNTPTQYPHSQYAVPSTSQRQDDRSPPLVTQYPSYPPQPRAVAPQHALQYAPQYVPQFSSPLPQYQGAYIPASISRFTPLGVSPSTVLTTPKQQHFIVGHSVQRQAGVAYPMQYVQPPSYQYIPQPQPIFPQQPLIQSTYPVQSLVTQPPVQQLYPGPQSAVIPSIMSNYQDQSGGPMVYVNQDAGIPGQNFRLLTTARSRPQSSPFGSQAAAYANQFAGQQQQGDYSQQQQQQQQDQFDYQQQGNQQQYQQEQQQGGYPQEQQQGYPQQGEYIPQQQGGYIPQQQSGYQQQGVYQQQGSYQQQGNVDQSRYDIPPESARQNNQPHLSREEKDKKARMVFKKYDKDGNGFLDIYEFLQAMNHLGADLSYADAQGIFAAFDENNQNSISIDQFAGNFCANY